MHSAKEYFVEECGVLHLNRKKTKSIECGGVGYFTAAIKDVKDVKVGDTVTTARDGASEPIPGFKEVKPMVFAGLYPADSDDYEDLREALGKLSLNDSSIFYEPETSTALGFGFRCGFLGMLHMEIVQERLDREFNQTIVTTIPNVEYVVTKTNGEIVVVDNPSSLPPVGNIEKIEEPYIRAQIICPAEYIGAITKLCMDRRGVYVNTAYLSSIRVDLTFELPLAEVIFDFYDKLKSATRGYASLDYELIGLRDGDLVKIDIMLNGDPVDALSMIVHRSKSYAYGRKLCGKLSDLIPRQMFEIAVQAAIGAKIIARDTIKALRKDVLAKCYGGDISRKRKLIEKQKEGKKRMKQVGAVEIPQEAFLAVLSMDE
jgi:GTP-binding protein LepA